MKFFYSVICAKMCYFPKIKRADSAGNTAESGDSRNQTRKVLDLHLINYPLI